MNPIKRLVNYFSIFERTLWLCSVLLITATFLLFDRESYLTLVASLVGATSLILAAKGHPLSQVLMILFSLLYGVISYGFRYWGEMITYLGMTLPMAAFALVSWLRNPFRGNRGEVAVARLRLRELPLMLGLTAAVTLLLGLLLYTTDSSNPLPGTLSVTTSFVAAYLTLRRSPYFALAYAVNDLVLILLWSLASVSDRSYLSVVACFLAFFVNDLYGFVSWRRMERRQRRADDAEGERV